MVKRNYFKRKQARKRRRSLKWLLFGGLFFCLAGGLIYLVVFSSVFKIEGIEIRTRQEFKYCRAEDIEQTAAGLLHQSKYGFIPQKSIFLAPIEKIKKAVLEEFPAVTSVSVLRSLPKSLILAVEERENKGLWCELEQPIEEPEPEKQEEEVYATSSEIQMVEATSAAASTTIKEQIPVRKIKKCFLLDGEGVIFKESPLVKGSLILNIYDKRGQTAEIGRQVLSLELLNFILALNQRLKEIKTGHKFLFAEADFEIVSTEDLRVSTSYGWQAYFNPGFPLKSQVMALETVLERAGYAGLEYIDLRIEGRAYYR